MLSIEKGEGNMDNFIVNIRVIAKNIILLLEDYILFLKIFIFFALKYQNKFYFKHSLTTQINFNKGF